MKKLFILTLFLFLSQIIFAAIRFVDLDGNHVSPFDSWANAATNIQNAIDVASANDTILITNGIYNVFGNIVVNKSLNIKSVNGYDATIIKGNYCRGFFLDSFSTTLSGLTITNGSVAFDNGGGILCADQIPVISNCLFIGNFAAYAGGGISGGSVFNCVFKNNKSDWRGGGAYESVLKNCTFIGNESDQYGGAFANVYTPAENCFLSNNVAGYGGGAYKSWLINCIITKNYSKHDGGGLQECYANNCTISFNHALWDGGGVGAFFSVITNCLIIENTAESGGGVADASVYNSIIANNSASFRGGGTIKVRGNNCTIINNKALTEAGGAMASALNNSIIYYNTAKLSNNYSYSTLSYCCTETLPPGDGNIDANPFLIDFSHIATNSPCFKAGTSSEADGLDIDGESWNSPPSIGCDEIHINSLTGSLTLSISAVATYGQTESELKFIAEVKGKISLNIWDFSDGTKITNWAIAYHSWKTPGAYKVILTAFNNSYPAGISATVNVEIVEQAIHYVNLNNPTPVSPYKSWKNAAINIQDAINVAGNNSTILITNAIYNISKEISVERNIILRSVNGAATTTINSDGTSRCFNLNDSYSQLIGLTITNGKSTLSGGGVYCLNSNPTINNCIVIGNTSASGGGIFSGSANNCSIIANTSVFGGGIYNSIINNSVIKENSGSIGGGAYNGKIFNSLIVNNEANRFGGICYSTAINCTIVSNNAIAENGGGVKNSYITNSIVYYNYSPSEPNISGGTLTYSCTTADGTNGIGNILGPPQFVDAFANNFHLQVTSPCIEKGTNLPGMALQKDLDGRDRINFGFVDMGCYEFVPEPGLFIYFIGVWLVRKLILSTK